jgi:hypothetical protein
MKFYAKRRSRKNREKFCNKLLNQSMIAPHTHKPDRLSPQPKQRSPPQPNTRSHISHIKQRSPQQPTNPIANSSNQTAIAPQHPTPDRLFPSSNIDRVLNTHKPDRLFPSKSNSDRTH